jgi:membrane-bound lytic murein transglycosylase A
LRPVSWDEVPFAPEFATALAARPLHQVITPQGETGLFTGYYEPELKGSWVKEGPYQFPLYAPPDLMFARADIASGALSGMGLELIWCADAVEVFFLHIQGSGKIILPDGRVQRVGFVAKNGRPYTAIGRVLRERGLLAPPVTMQAIKAWLRAQPDVAQDILNENASYIFFRLLQTEGPVGASGEVLQAEKSLAVDSAIWPYGLDVIVATENPLEPSRPFIRLMKTADTGSAIKGAIRGDIFFGSGERAAALAGALAHPGRLWIVG